MIETDGIQKQFGQLVRQYRKRQGLSQEELATGADLHRTYISDVERGARNISLQSITRIARALEIPTAALFEPVKAPPASAPLAAQAHGHANQSRKVAALR